MRTDFLPFQAEGRVEARRRGGEVLPGISVEEAPGHTPGHMIVLVESAGAAVLIGGDVSHHPIQVANPRWSSAGDVDPEQAAATRAAMFARVAAAGSLFAAGHYPAALGHVVGREGSLRWERLQGGASV